MSNPFIGEIRMFAGNFAPSGNLLCDGQLVPMDQYHHLYDMIGDMYGGDPVHGLFGIPDLRGRTPIHAGSAEGRSTYKITETGGTDRVRLTVNQMGGHTHTLQGIDVLGTDATAAGTLFLAKPTVSGKIYKAPPPATPATALASQAVGTTGGTSGHENRQPYLAISFVISVDGIIP